MILDVNDFGCVPDGRFLERAEIVAGSTVLTDSDGILRPTDVGKNIAIPGAADLVAKIARLIDRGDVRNVNMDAGSRELTGILFDPAKSPGEDKVAFKKSVHVGRRITVAGANQGQTLVTNIVAVTGETTIVLADAASTPVSGGTAILNRPDRVALDDYARHTVDSLTIEFKDRTIADGEMTIGGRALISATANFSSLDLDEPVTIPGAGLLVTTIQSFVSSTEVTLGAPAQREVTNGQADIWKTDSRPGLETLLAALDHIELASAEIRFGPGVYDFSRMPIDRRRLNAAIGLDRKKNLAIRGAGTAVTILRLMPQQDLSRPPTHVIETLESRNLTFSDFSVHGAYLTLAKTNEQVHGITLNEGSEDITVARVRVFQSAGDGLRFLGRARNSDQGTEENKVRRVAVDGCQFVQNKRTGIAFQRAVEFVSIRNCYIEMTAPSTDSCVDLEPSGLAPTDIIIDANFMQHGTLAPAVSVSGSSRTDPARRVKVSNNQIVGGHIFCTDVDQLTIQNNTVQVTDLGNVQRIPVHIALGGDSVVITGNLLKNDDSATKSVISLEGTSEVKRALVANNLCFARAGNGIQCLSSDDIAIEGNMIVATDTCNNGVLMRSESSAVDSVSVRNNDISVQGTGRWEHGIQIAADPKPIRAISVSGNAIRGARKGIVFEGDAFVQSPICALNRIADDVRFPLILTGNLLAHGMVVGGAMNIHDASARLGGARILAGPGSPEGRIIGNVGDMFQRLDGATGETLYVKEAENGTNTGWKAK